jgi:hypothetical protein
MIHDFKTSLAIGEADAHEAWWRRAREHFFGPEKFDLRVDDSTLGRDEAMKLQRAGVDRMVCLESGRVVQIQEKVRVPYAKSAQRRWPSEIFMEYENVGSDGSAWPGWAELKLDCDYILYMIVVGLGRVINCLDWRLTQRTWQDHKLIWKEEASNAQIGDCDRRGRPLIRSEVAKNETYVTRGLVVPLDRLFEAMRDSATLSLGDTTVR